MVEKRVMVINESTTLAEVIEAVSKEHGLVILDFRDISRKGYTVHQENIFLNNLTASLVLNKSTLGYRIVKESEGVHSVNIYCKGR